MYFYYFSLSNLVSLELRENMIKNLPQSISFLVKLEILDLGSNEIEELVCTNWKVQHWWSAIWHDN